LVPDVLSLAPVDVSAGEVRAVALLACSCAAGVDDARFLLDVLGIHPNGG
jgi:hypothetical protein